MTDAPRRRRSSVLYVDDSASNVDWLRALIARERIDLATAPNGESAIEFARCRQPDLIILELERLQASAVEVMRTLRESKETYRIPILGFASTECESLPGLSVYCRRPILGPELLGLLHALLGPPPGVKRGTRSRARARGRTDSFSCEEL